MKTSEIVYKLVQKIPKGKVLTYGAMGRAVGCSPRLIGKILHHNPDSVLTPCHRIIRSDGKIASGYAFGGPGVKKQMLEKEGVKFIKDKVDLSKFLWRFN